MEIQILKYCEYLTSDIQKPKFLQVAIDNYNEALDISKSL